MVNRLHSTGLVWEQLSGEAQWLKLGEYVMYAANKAMGTSFAMLINQTAKILPGVIFKTTVMTLSLMSTARKKVVTQRVLTTACYDFEFDVCRQKKL